MQYLKPCENEGAYTYHSINADISYSRIHVTNANDIKKNIFSIAAIAICILCMKVFIQEWFKYK